jgi:hypothetical protein
MKMGAKPIELKKQALNQQLHQSMNEPLDINGIHKYLMPIQSKME